MGKLIVLIGALLIAGCAKEMKIAAPATPLEPKPSVEHTLPIRVLVHPFSEKLAKFPSIIETGWRFRNCRIHIDGGTFSVRFNKSAKEIFPRYFEVVEFGHVSHADLAVDMSSYDVVVAFSLDKWTPTYTCGNTNSGPYCEYSSEIILKVLYRLRGSDTATYYVTKVNGVHDPTANISKCDILSGVITDSITKGMENGMIAVAKRVSEVANTSKQ